MVDDFATGILDQVKATWSDKTQIGFSELAMRDAIENSRSATFAKALEALQPLRNACGTKKNIIDVQVVDEVLLNREMNPTPEQDIENRIHDAVIKERSEALVSHKEELRQILREIEGKLTEGANG